MEQSVVKHSAGKRSRWLGITAEANLLVTTAGDLARSNRMDDAMSLVSLPAARTGFAQQADAQTQIDKQMKRLSLPIHLTTTTSATPTCRTSSTSGCVAALEADLSRAFCNTRRSKGRGTGCDTVSPRQQRQGRGVLPRRNDPGDAAPGEQAHPASPVTIYYAFKQSETEGDYRDIVHRLGDLS